MMLTANDTIIAELAAWQDRLALVSRNLGEINELPALQRVKARLRATPELYAGETASRINDALASLEELWKDYLLLNALLDEADTLLKQSGMFHDHEAEIRELLHGHSITLPVAHVPLAERGLLTKAERADKVTPEELLAAMNALFALAKDTILELDGAETRLRPGLNALLGTARELARRAGTLGFDAAKIVATAAPLEALGAELTADPLGAGRKLRDAEARLTEWRARLESAERERDSLEAAFAAAADELKELRRLSDQAQAAHDNSSSKIAGQSALPRPTEASVITQFGVWLDALDASCKQGDWRAAKSGLDKWVTACAAHQAVERQILAANMAPIEAREELRGRLKALRAKADAHAARGISIDTRVEQLGDEARDILYSQPADLSKAAALLGAYETAINLAIRMG
jgi:hypothetical protein